MTAGSEIRLKYQFWVIIMLGLIGTFDDSFGVNDGILDIPWLSFRLGHQDGCSFSWTKHKNCFNEIVPGLFAFLGEI